MILGANELSELIRRGNDCRPDGIALIPEPNLPTVADSGEASISLRLGRWFVSTRQSSETHIETVYGKATSENKITKKYFVPFGEEFVLHPGRFVLASTLEWLRIPTHYAAYVVGKSTLGRRGIIIETASGIHPGFSGCLTLEVANVGEIPVKLVAGQLICQIFFHSVKGKPGKSKTQLAGQRKPRLGQIKKDIIMERLKATKG
ncbi:dCTP deaminase [Methylocystis sp. JAN1]|uniref:dCTP deaminase n=1 Tax=Methylocystis sp. JAN1 TaxID=3397211 RepID=UPI003FA2966B